MNIREQYQQTEKQTLSPFACLSANSKGRRTQEDQCCIRTPFQRDRDRIIHCKSFRRMKHKTQVFPAVINDHYRTRLTHVIEVSQIARTIARGLRLNEDLTEAIALGHDLGHTPFGHVGESVLNEIHPGGFRHVEQSMRVVDLLEKHGVGLNLTHEVRDGIAKHSKGTKGPIDDPNCMPETMEGQVVRVSDLLAYANHDLDDAIRSGVITLSDVPSEYIDVLGKTSSQRVHNMVSDIIYETIRSKERKVLISKELENVISELKKYLFQSVYFSDKVKSTFYEAKEIVKELYFYFCENEEIFRTTYGKHPIEGEKHESEVCDFIAGMTDLYALKLYHQIFPSSNLGWDLSEF